MLVRRVSGEQVVDLRHKVLRAGLPRETAVFPGDDKPTARHYGAYEDDTLVGCVTLHSSQWEGGPAWQLRGMAVADGGRGRGVGKALIEFLEEDISDSGARQLWCNARVPAAAFYEKMGWRIESEAFEIPTAGPHMRMSKRMG